MLFIESINVLTQNKEAVLGFAFVPRLMRITTRFWIS